MDDDDCIPPHELEQLARSLSIDGALGRHDVQLGGAGVATVGEVRGDR